MNTNILPDSYPRSFSRKRKNQKVMTCHGNTPKKPLKKSRIRLRFESRPLTAFQLKRNSTVRDAAATSGSLPPRRGSRTKK